MTLEEAIIHCKEKACGNTQCALEHRQLAEWLQELQALRSNKNKIISPYFENGVFSGVRVTLGDEDFVIAPKDFRNGEEMTWPEAMDALKADNLSTWDYRQICHTMAYCDEVDEMLEENGGDSLDNVYWTSAEYLDNYSFVYNSYAGRLLDNRKENTFSVRAIKNLKK